MTWTRLDLKTSTPGRLCMHKFFKRTPLRQLRMCSSGWLLALLLGQLACSTLASSNNSTRSTPSTPAQPIPVLLDHDGGIDDFVVLLLLLAKPHLIDLKAVTILDADCRAEIAANTTIKLLHTLGADHIPVAVSTLPAVNAFPDLWRWSGLSLDVQPLINNFQPGELDKQLLQQPGQDYFAEFLLQQPEPITVVATGPLSNIAYAIQKYGNAVTTKIKEVWWMGGAFNVPGNVVVPGHDGSAEWNAFWDPVSMGVVWNSSVPLIVVPLDATNHVPITPQLLYRFGRQAQYRSSVLAGTIWSRVISWVYERPHDPYYAWDVLTAACLMQPSLCQRADQLNSYSVVAGASQGRTLLMPGGGEECPIHAEHEVSQQREVSVITHVDAEEFYQYVLDALQV